MNAVISGQAGVALLLKGSELSSVCSNRMDEVVRRGPREIPHLLGDAKDLQFLENVDVKEVGLRLDLATRKMDALHLALILLDAELAPDTRRTAAEELDEELATPEVVDFVERVLYSHPLPHRGDLSGALSSCTNRTDRARGLLQNLRRLQVTIAQVDSAWEQIPTEVFGSEQDRQSALAVAVREGIFRDLALTLAESGTLDEFRLRGLCNTCFVQVSNCRGILQGWTNRLRGASMASAWPQEFFKSRPQFVAEDISARDAMNALDVSVGQVQPYAIVYAFTCPTSSGEHRRLIPRTSLDIMKYIRGQGVPVTVLPDDGSPLDYYVQKGWVKEISEISIVGSTLDVVKDLALSWLYDKLKGTGKKAQAQNVAISLSADGRTRHYDYSGRTITRSNAQRIHQRLVRMAEEITSVVTAVSPYAEFPFPVCLEHTSKIVGWCKPWEDDFGLRARLQIDDEETWRRMNSGELSGLSIAGPVKVSECSICRRSYVDCNHISGLTYEKETCINIIKEFGLFEVSVVRDPVNQGCIFDLRGPKVQAK